MFCFDTTRTTIGFTYVYVCTLPQATLLYLVAHRPRASWTTSLTMELAGLVGVLIDYYELVVAPWLLSPTDALLYIPTGLSGDLFR